MNEWIEKEQYQKKKWKGKKEIEEGKTIKLKWSGNIKLIFEERKE